MSIPAGASVCFSMPGHWFSFDDSHRLVMPKSLNRARAVQCILNPDREGTEDRFERETKLCN